VPYPLKIALDAMGGDIGPAAVIPAANMVAEKNASVHFLIFGDENKVNPILDGFPKLKQVASVFHTEKMIDNDDKPSNALRNGKGSSMRLAIEAVRDGHADAIVSSGNTGALMALAKTVLKTIPGIHRPAICSMFPGTHGRTVMLDLGANVLVDAENLAQFAVMGAVFAKATCGITQPKVGLLNVGTEETKGPDHVKAASAILSTVVFPGKYIGYVEGNDITNGHVDVVVSDGYAGNIALKAIEGVGKMTGHFFKETLKSDPLSFIGMFLSYFALKRFKNKVDPRLYNGGVFLGLNGICIKSHGGSDALGFSTAIKMAVDLAQSGYIKTIGEEITHLMSQEMELAEGIYQEMNRG